MRKTERLRNGWYFCKGEFPSAVTECDFDDLIWQCVKVPHDWAANGPFYKNYDAQFTRIVNNGEKEESLHLGRTGGLPHDGKAVYRRKLFIPAEDKGSHFHLEFDGVMSHSRVYLNGIHVGGRPYGYSSFVCDITEQVVPGQTNQLTVMVDNPPASTRWYPGAGIYRNVRLVTTAPRYILPNGIWIRTWLNPDGSAKGEIRVEDSDGKGVFNYCVLDQEKRKIATGEGRNAVAQFEIRNCRPWEPADPCLYQAQISLPGSEEGTVSDSITCSFGVRSLEFDAEKGMFLNGKPFRMNGVCMHHDLGPLGAAFNVSAAKRQLEKLKSIGVNAFRCSHNPPDPGLLDLCDTMGLVVIDEAFDCWQMGKVAQDYHLHFDEWAEQDLCDMIRRDRNHPCVILWSIGNEILEQGKADGWKLAEKLQDIVHQQDPDRKVTAGLSFEEEAISNGMASVIDVPGFNYKPHRYQDYHNRLPGKAFYGSETASTLSSRGEYFFPVREGLHHHSSIHSSSYDVEYPSWATTPDREFYFQDHCPWVMGEFVWTGFDYLGEPCPYDRYWPAHSSYFGIFDLVGIPKDRAWLYRSRWRPDLDTLHILPHWNLLQRKGQITPVHVYTSFEEVELFVNGVSQGKRKKNGDARLCWDHVVFEPGELKAVAYGPDGSPAMTTVRKTTGVPAKLKLALENTEAIRNDGEDLAFVCITAYDSSDQEHPTASDRVTLTLNGPLEFAGIGNGDPTCLETFDQHHIHLFNGKAMVYLRAKEGACGTGTVLVEANHLLPDRITIQVVDGKNS